MIHLDKGRSLGLGFTLEYAVYEEYKLRFAIVEIWFPTNTEVLEVIAILDAG